MKFSFDEDQREFAATLRRALADRAPVSRWLRPDAAVAEDPAWSLLVTDLQAVAPDVPSDVGGLGLSVVELAIIAEELGRVVAPAAFTGGVGLAQGLLVEAVRLDGPGGKAAKALADSVGGTRLVLGAAPDRAWSQLTLDEDATVKGRFVAPVGAVGAQAIVAIADAADGPALVTVDAASAQIAALSGIDPSAGSAQVCLAAAPATVVLRDGVDEVQAWARRRARVVLAAEALGGARACLDMTVLYATQREQFGTAIGAFQAVKHRLADLLVETELAASAVYLAACELAVRDDSSELSSRAAVDVATAIFQRAARDCIQLHGGMGFTWEHPAHVYLERAELLAVVHGPAARAQRYDLIRRERSA
jgi:alkylation response protein AidB-like acyl-CoA dehydrogenase